LTKLISMLELTRKGLYCAAGDFYIDPSAKVDRAVITHAHSDHARRGSVQYYSTPTSAPLLRERLSKSISVQTFNYSEKFKLGPVTLSFHPAGHILGSAQVRMEYGGEIWVASGDYKRDDDPTCEPFETVSCDVFITEATFGTPAYEWDKKADVGLEIYEWWQSNAAQKKNSVLFAYSLGKAQRVLGLLEPYAKQSVICHAASTPLTNCYRDFGIKLAPTRCLSKIEEDEVFNNALFLLPQSFLKSEQAKILGEGYLTAFASGWMATEKPGFSSYDKGFLLSDHADWPDLVRTVLETGAKKVYVQHRGHGALVRHLNKLGVKAFPDTALVTRPLSQLELF
jgi:putative mRNA 3-end processing factor